jgi:hypothetical protein
MKLTSILISGAAAALIALSSTGAMAGCDKRSGCTVKAKPASCAVTSSCRTVEHKRVVAKPVERYGWRTSKVLVSHGSLRLVREPAVYETRKERVMVRPASFAWRIEPAVYKTVTRKHVSTGCGISLFHHRDCGGCHSSCRVAKSVTRVSYTTERVKVREGRCYTVAKPAEYVTRTVRVRVAGGGCHLVHTPTVYKTVRERVRLSGGSCLLGHHACR